MEDSHRTEIAQAREQLNNLVIQRDAMAVHMNELQVRLYSISNARELV